MFTLAFVATRFSRFGIGELKIRRHKLFKQIVYSEIDSNVSGIYPISKRSTSSRRSRSYCDRQDVGLIVPIGGVHSLQLIDGIGRIFRGI